jgi:hypothetical protein
MPPWNLSNEDLSDISNPTPSGGALIEVKSVLD